MTTETRYTNLLDAIVGGPYYDPQGIILPFRSGPTQLRILTPYLNTNFLILINNINSGIVTTDIDGTAVFSIVLPLGELVLELLREGTTTKLKTYLTVRETAVWHAALAEQFESIDDSIDSTLNSFYLAEAGPVDIDLAHGVVLRYPNDTPAELEAYREILQLVRQSTRQYTGRLSGKYGIVAALTQINPYIFERYKTGPKWVLGYDLLFDSLQNHPRYVDTANLTNINASGQFITLNSVDDYTFVGSGSLKYNPYFNKLIWSPPVGATINTPFIYETPEISASGEHVLPSGRIAAVVEGLYTTTPLVLAQYDHLYLEVDKLGIVDVNLLLNGGLGGTGGVSITTVINAAFQANNTYNSKRSVLTQPAGSLINKLEIVRVSDNTDISISSVGSFSTATLPDRIRYTAPGGTAGPYNNFVSPSTLMRLYSGNNIDYVDVIWNGQSGVSDSINIQKRYIAIATLISLLKTRLTSKNIHVIDGESSITIHDGGGNAATSPISGSYRGWFDVPKIYTTLSANVVASAISIQIPTNDVDKFNLAKGNNNFPFDVIVGYGHRAGVSGAASFSVSPDSSSYTARITSSSSLFEIGDTHVNIYMVGGPARYRINNGVHKIIEYISTTQVRVSYSGIGCPQPSNITGISILGVDHKSFSTSVIGSIAFTFATKRLKWQAPGDSTYGAEVTVSGDGYNRLYSNNGQYLDILVDYSLLPVADQADTIYVRHFMSTSAAAGDILNIWSSGEKATVISVTSGTPDVWNLKSPIIGNYTSGQSVYLRNGQFPLHIKGEDKFGELTVTANTAITKPASVVIDTLNITGTTLPNGWVKTSIFTPTFTILNRFSKYEKGILMIGSGGVTSIEKDIPFNNNLRGLSFSIKAYVYSSAADGVSAAAGISVNFGFGFIAVANNPILDMDDVMRQPQLVAGSITVPLNATKFRLQIFTGAATASVGLEKVIIVQNPNQSLYLGHGTIPRNDSRSKFGSLMYVWSPDQLSQNELNTLGLTESITLPNGTYNGASPITGRIADSINTQEEFDVFDITDVVGGNVVNVRGSVTDLDWAATTLINMETVIRSPRRFSYVKPSIISYQNEDPTFTTSPPYKATLSVVSDQDQLHAFLYEDEIPVPQDQWQFNTSTEIEIISGFNAAAQYRFEYQALIQVETAPIDIVSPSPNGADTWIADYLAWNRHDTVANSYRTEISIEFNANLQATLSQRSDADKLQSVLTENNGLNKRIVPQQAWNYIDSLNVKISGSEFNANSIYTFTYNQQIPDTTRVASILAEIRSAASIFSLGTATYSPYTLIGDNIADASKRYHQIRLTISNVGTLEDTRIHSTTLRGLRLNTPPIVPGL